MARRPAYNSKAEIARRAASREALLAEFAGLDDEAERLIPVISSFVQYHRRLNEYRALRGRAFDRYRRDVPIEDMVVEAREHWEIAFSLNHVAGQAGDLLRDICGEASSVALHAGDLLRLLKPYTAEEVETIRALYEE